MRFGKDADEYDNMRKMEIVNAAERALEKTSFEELTVTSICSQIGISRPTLYRYFEDKFDMVQWLWDIPSEEYMRNCGQDFSLYESNLFMTQFFAKHTALFTAALKDESDYNSLINHGCRQRIRILTEYIGKKDPLSLTENIRFQIEFFVSAESRTIARWVLKRGHEPFETVARRIESCAPKELHDLIAAQKQTEPTQNSRHCPQ